MLAATSRRRCVSLLHSFDLPVRLRPAMKASGSAIGKEQRQESSILWGTDDSLGVCDCARVNETPLAHTPNRSYCIVDIAFSCDAEEQTKAHTIEAE
jgi:hypothetical protein